MRGELDAASAPGFLTALQEMDGQAAELVVSDVTCMDSKGLQTLIPLASHPQLRLAAVSKQIERVIASIQTSSLIVGDE